jgi:hypothetical protein
MASTYKRIEQSTTRIDVLISSMDADRLFRLGDPQHVCGTSQAFLGEMEIRE